MTEKKLNSTSRKVIFETNFLFRLVSVEQLKVSVGNMFVAGIETSSSTLLIGCLHIIENPDVMAKIQLELDSVVGRDEMIRMEHRGERRIANPLSMKEWVTRKLIW